MIEKGNLARYVWVNFLERKSDTADALGKFLANERSDGVPSELMMVRSDDGEEFLVGDYEGACRCYRIKQEFTSAMCPKLNGVAKKALGITQNAELAARI